MIKWNDIEINKVKKTDVSLGLCLLSGCHRFLKGFIRRKKESESEREIEKRQRG